MRQSEGSRRATFQSGFAGTTLDRGRRSGDWRFGRLIGPWLLLAVFVSSTSAATVSKASTSRTDRDAAIREIPFDQLTPEARQRIQKVVDKPSLYRRMPANVIECDPKLYRFLVRYPEVVVNIWQLMGITKVNAKRVGPYTLDATDGAGTTTKIELVYGTQDLHLLYCEGTYEGPLFSRPLKGRCVLLLKSGYQQHDNQTWSVSNRMDVFLQIDNMAVDVVTRTLHPLLGKSADVNFVESTNFVERISNTSEENGPGMTRLSMRLDQVEPDIREQFSLLTSEVYSTAQARLDNSKTAQISAPPGALKDRK